MPGSRGGENEEPLFKKFRVSVLQDERVLWMNDHGGSPVMWVSLMPLNCACKKAKMVNSLSCAFYHN